MNIDEVKKEIYHIENVDEREVLNQNDYVYFYINKETYNKPQYEKVMRSALEHVGVIMLVIENPDKTKAPGRGIIDSWADWLHTKEKYLNVLYGCK